MPRRNLHILMLATFVCLICYFRGTRSRYAPTIADAMGVIADYYIEPVDRRALYESAMSGMVNELDEYSSYIPPVDYDQLQEELDQEFAGVGIEVGIDPNARRLMVLSPIVGSPAFREGLRAGDLIIEIDGTDTEDMRLEDSVKLMRGMPGTSVDIVVQPFDTIERKPITIVREHVRINSVLGDTRNRDGTWNYVLQDHPEIGFLRLTSFGDATSRELAAAIEPLLNSTNGAILDLRGNPGGLLNSAVEVCDLFLEAGTVVSVRRRSGYSRTSEGKAKNLADARDAIVADSYESSNEYLVPHDYPIAILIDRYSASASEIVAACLQDYDRAVIVGQRSWGKGTVQNVFDLEGGKSAMKLTTATYWRPSGTNIHRFSTDTDEDTWGVRPNEGYEIVYTEEQMMQRFRERQSRNYVEEVRQGMVKNEPVLPKIVEETLDDDDANDSQTAKENGVEEKGDDDALSSIDANDDSTDKPTAKDSEPFLDTQLQRAVEYIESCQPKTTREAA